MVLFTVLVVICLTLGLTLIGIEIILPGFGIVGISGIALVVAGASVAYYRLDTTSQVVAVSCSIVFTGIIVMSFRKSKIARGLVLETVQTGKASDQQLSVLLGQEGKTVTSLRPSGIARINGKTVDVVSRGDFVEAGEDVRVVEVRGMRVVVELVNLGI